jgi:hypothetical protein
MYPRHATSNKHASGAGTLKLIHSDTTTALIKLCLAKALSSGTATKFAAGGCFRRECSRNLNAETR